MLRKKREKVMLDRMLPGQKGQVVSFLYPEHPAMKRLAVLGFIPGEIFTLERRRPEYLIRYGYTILAINKRIARWIMVHKMEVPYTNR